MTARLFRGPGEFAPDGKYRLLPFRFGQLDDQRYVLTNDVGEHVVLRQDDLHRFVDRTLQPSSAAYAALKSRHFFFDSGSRVALELLAMKLRTRQDRIAAFTGLHMFVVTLRCDLACQYCQVSRQNDDRAGFDMSVDHADRALDLTFRSPSPTLKIEFQGGEPLLNFPLIEHIVRRAEVLNREHRRDVQFVIATNLTRMDEAKLAFCKEHRIQLSTSLDGPADLHDAQRPSRSGSSHAAAVAGIERARAALGNDAVSALMTTTHTTLGRVEDVIDEYVRLGFRSIFLRHLSPYGFAVKRLVGRYSATEWVDFYKRGLAHVLAKNAAGYVLREEMTAILLQKMFAPMGAAYVDLQSPAGIGIGGVIYNYDGSVYASDEGRMLAEMGDTSFRLGHVSTDSYEDIFRSETLVNAIADTMLEGVPMCSDCPFLPYCGADPVFHQATANDMVGHKAFSAFCARQMGIVRHLITLLEDDERAREILMGWL